MCQFRLLATKKHDFHKNYLVFIFIRIRRRFFNPIKGKRNVVFYTPMLRNRSEKSLDLRGFQSTKRARQRKDTFSLKIAVLLRNKSTAKE